MAVSNSRGWHQACLLALSTCLGLFSHAAAADDLFEDASIRGTNTTVIEGWADNKNGREGDDNFVLLVNRLESTAEVGDLSVTARLDAMEFGLPPTGAYCSAESAFSDAPVDVNPLALELRHQASPGNCGVITLERISAVWEGDAFVLRAGDFYRQLGHGIALAMRKVSQAGIDRAIRGGEVTYEGESLSLSAFGGTVVAANLDSINRRYVQDPLDWLAGAEGLLAATDDVQLGFFGVYGQPQERLLPDSIDWTATGGATLRVSDVLGATFDFEVLAQQRALAGALQQGSGAYATAQYGAGAWSFLFEGMYLNDLQQRGSLNTSLDTPFLYNQPPTLERIDQEVPNSRDLVGGRTRVEWSDFEHNLLLYGNGVVRLNDPGEAAPLLQVHVFGGGEWGYGSKGGRVSSALGYRDEVQSSRDGEWRQVRDMWLFDLFWIHPLTGDLALHIASQNQFWRLEGLPYQRGSTFIGLEKAGRGSATVEIGYDNQNSGADVRQAFLAAIASLELGQAWSARATVGTQRGGLKCVAGVCRDFPPFAGARLELAARF